LAAARSGTAGSEAEGAAEAEDGTWGVGSGAWIGGRSAVSSAAGTGGVAACDAESLERGSGADGGVEAEGFGRAAGSWAFTGRRCAVSSSEGSGV
jgi:hypothetical protein